MSNRNADPSATRNIPEMNFQDLRLSKPVLRAVQDEGHETPTLIQARAIPPILDGRDVLGFAPTGTGKTAAFTLPILQKLDGDNDAPTGRNRKMRRTCAPRALVLCPTRELATQIHERWKVYGKYLRLRTAEVYGGVNLARQARHISYGVAILVATPGRLIDLIGRGHVDLGSVQTLVLDEADRMLDMGFIPDIRKIIKLTPQDRQTLLFSATIPSSIRQLAESILTDHVFVEAPSVEAPSGIITQLAYMVERNNKPQLLNRILARDDMERTLVFTRTKHGADKVAKAINKAGIQAASIHGNKNQSQRNRALNAFKSGQVPVLVATDVASRGIDVDHITHVINVDLPNDAETYTHRIGRTGRAGADGTAITFCAREDVREFRKMEHDVEAKIKRMKDEKDLLFIEPENPGKPGKKKPGKGRGSRNTAPPAWSKFNRSSRSEGQSNRKSSSGKKSDPRMGRKKYDNASPEEQDSSSRRERRHEEGSGRKPWQGKPRSEGRKAPQGKPRTEGRKAPHDKTGPATDKPRKKHKTTDPAKKAKHSTEKVGTEERSADQKPRSGKKRFQPTAPKKKKAKRLGRREREAAKAKKRGKKSKRPSVN